MNRVESEIATWGTEIYISAGSDVLSEIEIQNAVAEVEKFLLKVDCNFSTYKADSAVSKLRNNKMQIAEAPELVQEVWHGCLKAKELTNGSFDPWQVDGGFDPSGYVKGWAAQKAAAKLVDAGCTSVQVNAAGDIALRGNGPDGKPWKIGVINPDNRGEIVKVFEITDGNIATSGSYEKGAHIRDPHTGLIAIGAKSATVIGPDGGLCDAFATALMVDGTDAANWIVNSLLIDYTFWSIDRYENTAWSFGPNIGL